MKTLRNLSTGRVVLLAVVAAVAASMGGCTPSGTDGNGTGATLPGTWTGDVTYLPGLSAGGGQGGQSFSRSFTVTFDAQNQPNAIDVPIDNDVVAVFTVAAPLKEGDVLQQTVLSGSTNVKVTGVVSTVSASSTSFSVTLNLTTEYQGYETLPLAGPYTLTAQIRDDGNLSWSGTGELKIQGSPIPVNVPLSATGTLTKQS